MDLVCDQELVAQIGYDALCLIGSLVSFSLISLCCPLVAVSDRLDYDEKERVKLVEPPVGTRDFSFRYLDCYTTRCNADKHGHERTPLFLFLNQWENNDVDLVTAPIYEWERKDPGVDSAM